MKMDVLISFGIEPFWYHWLNIVSVLMSWSSHSFQKLNPDFVGTTCLSAFHFLDSVPESTLRYRLSREIASEAYCFLGTSSVRTHLAIYTSNRLAISRRWNSLVPSLTLNTPDPGSSLFTSEFSDAFEVFLWIGGYEFFNFVTFISKVFSFCLDMLF